jgi:hypothetical protein
MKINGWAVVETKYVVSWDGPLTGTERELSWRTRARARKCKAMLHDHKPRMYVEMVVRKPA